MPFTETAISEVAVNFWHLRTSQLVFLIGVRGFLPVLSTIDQVASLGIDAPLGPTYVYS